MSHTRAFAVTAVAVTCINAVLQPSEHAPTGNNRPVLIAPVVLYAPDALRRPSAEPASRGLFRPPLVALPVPHAATMPAADAPPTSSAGRVAQLTTSADRLRVNVAETASPVVVGNAAAGLAQTYARQLVGPAQWPCLRRLWQRESGWRPTANNPSSSAYGIAQLLTETSTDAAQQIRDGLVYITARYGDTCTALTHSNETGWY
jgi:hypothetical protein